MTKNDRSKLWALLFLLCVTGSSCYNILGLFPHPGLSHFHFFRPIMRALADAGHNVDVLGFFPEKQPPNGYTDYPLIGENLSNAIGFEIFENFKWMSGAMPFVGLGMLHNFGLKSCNHTLHSDALAEILKHKGTGHYDVIIVEAFNTDCMVAIAHQLKAPVVAVSSSAMMPWHYERMGSPIIPSYISALFMGQSQEMPYGGRLANWIIMHSLNWLYKLISIPATDALVRERFGPQEVSVGELVKSTAVMLINQHFSLSGPKPVHPNVIEVGGLHIQEAKELPAELKQLLDKARQGVVLISFGSQLKASSMPVEKREVLLRAVGRLQQLVIWKWEEDELPNKPQNLHTMKWLPQRDILCHPNVKVFMSHGGLMGITEAVHCGVAIVGMPMFGDQDLNIAALVQRRMATPINYFDFSEESLFQAFSTALSSEYRANAKVLAHAFNHRPQKPLDTAVWWVENVAAAKGAPLTQPQAVHMSRFTYYSLDVHLTLLGVFVIFLIVWIWIIRRCCRKSPSKSSKSTKSQGKRKKN